MPPLPHNPDLHQLRDHAKSLRDLVRSGADGALDLVRSNHPRHTGLLAGSEAARSFKLADAQLVLARHYGFNSWPRLRRQVELMNALTRAPHRVETQADPADELLRLGCLTYGADNAARPREAQALLTRMPELSQASLATAAAVGDAPAAAAIIAADPVAVRRPSGPFHWEPLLYLTYSRIAQRQSGGDAAATARVLLAAGADPNAGYLWEGLVPPFTVLTGVFGGGEGSQPQHPRWRELGELLLAAGADPNDGQTIYNRGLGDLPHDDTAFLELLFRHGLGTDTPSPWRDRFGGQLDAPADLLAEVLQHAAEADLPQRATLVLAHGADPDRPARHPVFAGRTPLQSALRHGNLAIARRLEAAGADASVVDDRLRLQAVLLAGDAGAARTAGADREAIERLRAAEPRLVIDAAQLHRSTAVEVLVSLGWDVNAHGRASALHLAALAGDDAMVEVLLRLGADPTQRDAHFDAPAAGWAAHGCHDRLAARLTEAAAAWPVR